MRFTVLNEGRKNNEYFLQTRKCHFWTSSFYSWNMQHDGYWLAMKRCQTSSLTTNQRYPRRHDVVRRTKMMEKWWNGWPLSMKFQFENSFSSSSFFSCLKSENRDFFASLLLPRVKIVKNIKNWKNVQYHMNYLWNLVKFINLVPYISLFNTVKSSWKNITWLEEYQTLIQVENLKHIIHFILREIYL